MMLRWTPRSLRDVERVRAFIARDAPGNAAVVVRRVLDAVDMLRDFPELGRSGRAPDTRELVVARTPYVVAYRVSGETVVLLRILHGARRWPSE